MGEAKSSCVVVAVSIGRCWGWDPMLPSTRLPLVLLCAVVGMKMKTRVKACLALAQVKTNSLAARERARSPQVVVCPRSMFMPPERDGRSTLSAPHDPSPQHARKPPPQIPCLSRRRQSQNNPSEEASRGFICRARLNLCCSGRGCFLPTSA